MKINPVSLLFDLLSIIPAIRKKFSILVPATYLQHNKLADVPTSEDKFGYEEFARAITKKISASMLMGATPLTIGIHGAWGTGKSSFLKLTQKELEKEGIRPIWFNAWKYNQEENLWSALLQKILDDAPLNYSFFLRPLIKLRLNLLYVNFGAGALEVTKKTIALILRLALVILGAGIALGFFSIQLSEILIFLSSFFPKNNAFVTNFFQPKVARWISALIAFVAANPKTIYDLFSTNLGIDISKFQKKRAYKDHISFLDNFDKDFRRIIKITSNKKPLVIFIDDLDRCLPEKAMQVLEAIKLFLDVENCIFLIAVDREVIERAVYLRYAEQSKNISENTAESSVEKVNIHYLAQSYLEKIIQLPFNIPPLDPINIKDYVHYLYPEGEKNNCNKIFSENLSPNPRKIKRVIQTFLLLSQISEERRRAKRKKNSARKNSLDLNLLAKLVIIENQFRNLHQDIIVFPELLDGIERILRQNETDLPESVVAISDAFIYQSKIDAYIKNAEISRLFKSDSKNGSFLGKDVTDYVYLLKTVREIPLRKEPKEELKSNEDIANENVPNTSENVSDASVEMQTDVAKKYLNVLINLNQNISLQGITPNINSVSAKIEDIFVSLDFEDVVTSLTEDPNPVDEPRMAYTLAEILVLYKRIVFLGEPGSGKTVLFSYMTTILSQSFLSDPSYIKTKLGLDEFSILPIPFKFRDLSRFLVEKSEEKSSETTTVFLDFLYSYFGSQQISLPEQFFESYLERGKGFILGDGFDEITDRQIRNRIARIIENVSNRYANCRFSISSRIVGYSGAGTLSSGFKAVRIKPLNTTQKKALLTNLTYASSRENIRTKNLVADNEIITRNMIELISESPSVSRLSDNPLMLAVMSSVYGFEGRLPNRRTDLYRIATELLLGGWDEIKGVNSGITIGSFKLEKSVLFNILSSIALGMHEEKVREINTSELMLVLHNYTNMMGNIGSDFVTHDFIDWIRSRSGLFVEKSPEIYGFTHLAFQEYLTSAKLSNKDTGLDLKPKQILDKWWREVIVLLSGILGSRRRYSELNNFISTIMNIKTTSKDDKKYILILSADCVNEADPAQVATEVITELSMQLKMQKIKFDIENELFIFKEKDGQRVSNDNE